MCDKGCLVDIRNTKEDVEEMKKDIKEILKLAHDQHDTLTDHDNRLIELEEKEKTRTLS